MAEKHKGGWESECAAKAQDKDAARTQGSLMPLVLIKGAVKVCNTEMS